MPIVTTFGELMLRLKTPGFQRFIQSSTLEATFGGGEANVSASLARLGHTVRWVSAIPEGAIGDWALTSLRGLGVDVSHVLRQGDRLGIYMLEAGASQRPSQVIYDRAGSSISQVKPGQVPWDRVLAGGQWFHTTGITPALSEGAAASVLEALIIAKRTGIMTSIDLNYRKKLWTKQRAGEVMTNMMSHTDVLIANEEDCESVFGIKAGKTEVSSGSLEHERYLDVAKQALTRFPNVQRVAITLRESKNASENGWSGLLVDRQGHDFSRHYDITIVDRVGAGDSFAAGLIHALLAGKNRKETVEFATAASALKHTIPGDLNLVTEAEIESLAKGDVSGRVQR